MKSNKKYFYFEGELKEDKVVGGLNNFGITLSDIYAIE